MSISPQPSDRHEDVAAQGRYFVIWNGPDGKQIVGEHATKLEAERHHQSLVGWGWPKTRSASIYIADHRQQLEDHLSGRVRLVCVAVGAGYWESPEGVEQAERQRAQEERDLQEDLV